MHVLTPPTPLFSRAGDIVFGLICISLVVFLKVCTYTLYIVTYKKGGHTVCNVGLVYSGLQYLKVHTEGLKESRTQTWASRAAFKFLWFICTGMGYHCVMQRSIILLSDSPSYIHEEFYFSKPLRLF